MSSAVPLAADVSSMFIHDMEFGLAHRFIPLIVQSDEPRQPVFFEINQIFFRTRIL